MYNLHLNKLFSVFVLFLLVFSAATFTSAQGSSGSSESDDSDDDTLDSSDDNSELEDDSEDVNDDNSENETEENDDIFEVEDDDSEDVNDDSELENEDDSENETDDSVKSLRVDNSGPSDVCANIFYAERKLFKLNDDLANADSDKDALKIKSEIASVEKKLEGAKEACANRPTLRGVAVGKTCEVSAELKQSLIDIKEKYVAAIEAKDFEAAKTIRAQGEALQKKVMDERRSCMEEKVPGLMARVAEKCNISEELNDKLDRARNRVSELEKINAEVPAELKKDISELEDKIATIKAKCNALKVDSNVDGKKIREYYNQRLSEALENEDEDTKIQDLKELRKEIDETIKNLVENKKKLKFDEVDGLVSEIKFKAKSTSVGDSETTDDVEVEVEVDDSNVTVESTDDDVLLTEDGVEFTADDVTIDEDGISVGGVLVKKLPSDVFKKNKNLERHANKITTMKLEKDGEKIVYRTKYESRRKLFGFIGVNAKNGVTTDAETGETVSEDTPWWNGLSSDAEDDSSKDSTEDESVENVVESDTTEPVVV